MRRLTALLVGIFAGVTIASPNIGFGHYWFQKAIANATAVIARGTSSPASTPVLSAPSAPQFFCRSPDGVTTFNGPHATLATAQTNCTLPSPAATDAPQRVIFEVTTQTETVSTTTPITTTTARVNVFGNTTLRVSDAHAQMLMIGGTPAPIPGAGGAVLAYDWTCEDTHTAASASQAAVNTAITAADDGDCVDVPSGSATYSSLDLQDKDLWVRGQTVVSCSGTPGTSGYSCTAGGTPTTVTGSIQIDLSARQRVSGFTITGGDAYRFEMVGNQAAGTFFRIDHNRLISTTGWNPTRVFGGNNGVHPQGVWDHNRLENGIAIHTNGSNWLLTESEAQHQIWAKEPILGGTTEVVYVEANYFVTNTNTTNFTDGNYAGRVVIRFNTTSGSAITAFEFHSPQGANRGYQSHETYNNAVVDIDINDNCFHGFASVRGGSGVMFNNAMSGDHNGCNFDFLMDNVRSTTDYMTTDGVAPCAGASPWDQNTGGQQGWHCRDQIGTAYDSVQWENSPAGAYAQVFKPFYVWGNTRGGVPASVTPDDNGRVTLHIVEEREFYDTSTATGSPQTVGVRVGTIANRPAGCTAGVAYWATDEGEWNSLSAGADGQLYKCTSTNNWTLYYTPHQFPHEWAQ